MTNQESLLTTVWLKLMGTVSRLSTFTSKFEQEVVSHHSQQEWVNLKSVHNTSLVIFNNKHLLKALHFSVA